MMNTARLARKWNEAKGNYAEMAEALGEEIDDPAGGLVSRDYLDKRFAEFEARFTWKIVGLLGVQIVIFSLITKFL
jgi:hypothetical protein